MSWQSYNGGMVYILPKSRLIVFTSYNCRSCLFNVHLKDWKNLPKMGLWQILTSWPPWTYLTNIICNFFVAFQCCIILPINKKFSVIEILKCFQGRTKTGGCVDAAWRLYKDSWRLSGEYGGYSRPYITSKSFE